MSLFSKEILFPFQIDSSGRVASTTDPDVIVRQRITQIVMTIMGERVMRPTFGAGAWEYLFENINAGGEALIADKIRTAVHNLTTGIRINSVRIDDSLSDESTVGLQISYSYEQLGEEYNSEVILNMGITTHN